MITTQHMFKTEINVLTFNKNIYSLIHTERFIPSLAALMHVFVECDASWYLPSL